MKLVTNNKRPLRERCRAIQKIIMNAGPVAPADGSLFEPPNETIDRMVDQMTQFATESGVHVDKIMDAFEAKIGKMAADGVIYEAGLPMKVVVDNGGPE